MRTMISLHTLLLFTTLILIQSFTPLFRGGCRLFLDTASEDEWESLLDTGIFHGVTCNPTLLERANQPCTISNLHRMYTKAMSYKVNEFMCQAWGATSEDMYNCGMTLSEPDRERIVVKVPVTQEGVQAASELVQSNVRVCLTACYHPKQAIIAAGVGAEYLAPYLGRMTDNGRDGAQDCLDMMDIVEGLDSGTRILVASIRSVESIETLAAAGMDTFTFSPDVARELLFEETTAHAASVFEEAAKKGN